MFLQSYIVYMNLWIKLWKINNKNYCLAFLWKENSESRGNWSVCIVVLNVKIINIDNYYSYLNDSVSRCEYCACVWVSVKVRER